MVLKKYRQGIFIVTYSKVKGKIYYLVLKRKLHWKGWEFPKGGRRFYETLQRAVKRELKEETGLIAIKIKKFNISGKYKYNKSYPDRESFIGQTFEKLYAVEVKKTKIKLDKLEHSGYKWASFSDAVKKLKWPNQRKCLRVVNAWLKNEI